MPNAIVTWSVASGGGSVANGTSTTDSFGDASVAWTLGTTAGASSRTASLASGDQQSVSVDSAAAPFVVRAVDQYGNAVRGVTINCWTSSDGALSGASSTPGSDGLAQVTYTLGTTAGAGVPRTAALGTRPISSNGRRSAV